MSSNMFIFGSIAIYIGIACLMAGGAWLYANSLPDKNDSEDKKPDEKTA